MDKDGVLKILRDIRPEFDFADNSDFFEEGMLDSFDLVVLVSNLDKTYSISIKGTDITPENFKNLTSIVLLLDKYGAGKNEP